MTGKEILNIALVGCGGMARRYRGKYTQIPGAQLKLLVDVSEDVAREAAAELGVERWSTDFKDALAEDIDIIDISTPNFLHAEQAIAAMKAGKHVLLQKPIAPSITEAEAIIRAACESDKKTGMYMSMFDVPLYYEIRRMIEQGVLGKVSGVYCRGAHRGGLHAVPDRWRNSLEKTGGGAFIQLTIHFLNMAQWLVGEEIVRVSAFSKNRLCPNIGGDDATAAACEFESGMIGTLEASYSSDPNIIAIYGTKGFVSVMDNYKLDIKLDECYEGEVIQYTNPGEVETHKILKPQDTPYEQHIKFVKAVLEDNPAQIPMEIGLRDLKIVKAVYKSAEENRVVDVSEL